MLMRLDWQDPRGRPPRRWRPPPGRLMVILFWACIVFCVLTQLLLF